MLNSETQEWPDPELAILIPAAGLGTRLGLGPKAWLKIGEYSLLKCLGSRTAWRPTENHRTLPWMLGNRGGSHSPGHHPFADSGKPITVVDDS